MNDEIKKYVKEELAKLSEDNKSVKLQGVFPSILQELIEDFDWSEADPNGWQADYWLKTNKYDISGSMYYGEVTITLR